MLIRYMDLERRDIECGQRIFIIGDLRIPVLMLFQTQLEYTFYTPRTEANRVFHVFSEFPYFMIGVPANDLDLCEKTAKHLGLTLRPNLAEGSNYYEILNPAFLAASRNEILQMRLNEVEQLNIIFLAHGETPIPEAVR